MAKKFFVILVLCVFAFACGDKKTEKAADDHTGVHTHADGSVHDHSKDAAKDEAVTAVTVDDFQAKAEGLMGKKVSISGTVVHVCEHSGKKVFIVNEKPDLKVKIEAGKNIAKFEQELNGSDIEVFGVVKEFKIDEAYLANWEKELKEGKKDIETHEGHDHAKKEAGKKESATNEDGKTDNKDENCETEANSNEEAFKKIAAYRKQIAEATKGYLSFFSVECDSFKVKK